MPPLSVDAAGREYLSTAELSRVTGLSGSIFLVGQKFKHSDKTHTAKWVNPPGLDARVTKWLGGEATIESQNFLDSHFGAAITPLSGAVLLMATDIAYPSDDTNKDVLQSQFLFMSGSLLNKGLTDLAKGLVRRRRPFLNILTEPSGEQLQSTRPDDNFSFFSGHTSSAFFAMSFLNLRFRKAMRNQMKVVEYNNWRWLSPTVTFGWAAFVGYSRIEANRHYLTDVLAGATVGTLLGELFYKLGEKGKNSGKNQNPSLPLTITIRF